MSQIFSPNMPTSKFKNFDNEIGDMLIETDQNVKRKSSVINLGLSPTGSSGADGNDMMGLLSFSEVNSSN